MQRQIVIVTSRLDAHADVMVRKLAELGHEPIRLNTEDLPGRAVLSLGIEKGDWHGGIELTNTGRRVHIDDVGSVWVRRPGSYSFGQEVDRDELLFSAAELNHVLGGLWASLDCYWMSRPDLIRSASWKGEQLQRAARMGFHVPRSLITTDPHAFGNFYADCGGRVIYKCVAGAFALAKVAQQSHEPHRRKPLDMQTVMVGERELQELESVRLSPCLFQEYIDKDRELRVTVIGDEVFAAEIHSQQHPKTSLDFRYYDVKIPYLKARLPDDLERRCVEFVRSYGLTFSAIDLILTPEGEYVFIENNPVGQFMFVERLVPELRMTEALASCLIRGCRG